MNHLLRQLALSCDYENLLKATTHGKRQHGLSKCATYGVEGTAMIQLGGHSSNKTNAGYHRPNQQSADWIIAAKHRSPNKIRADLEAYQTKQKMIASKKSSPEPPSVRLSSKKKISPKPLFSPSAAHFGLSQIDLNANPPNSTQKGTKSYSKKPILHPDYVHNRYQNYSDLDDGPDNRKASPLDSSPDSSAATSEARDGKLGKHTQPAFRPKKKKKKKKKVQHNHYQPQLSISSISSIS